MASGVSPLPDWARVRPLLERCLDLSEIERESFLAEAADDKLAEQVRFLLDVERAGDERRLLEPLEARTAEDRHGTVVGAWRLVQRLGEGGMGVVWLGERADGEFQQQVAVKLFKLPLSQPEYERRFLAEIRILAALDHRGIARLLDGGRTEGGIPYIALEYVDGRPIDEWCDMRRLTVDERVELFLRACDAVQHAHERGVLHRDLKPANLLVGSNGEPRLVDFGIAKVVGEIEGVGDTKLTGTGQRLYTPRYASPEQVRGDATSATADVYSLGVILYELLSGVPPYSANEISQFELERAVVETDAPRPSTIAGAGANDAEVSGGTAWSLRGLEARGDLRARLRGDLDWVLLAALRKDPARRYATVREFADDLRRHLARQPVRARPESWAYRARRFVQRNRGLSFGATTTLLALAVGLVVALGLYREARDEHEASLRLAYQAALAAAEGAIADGLANQARESLDAAPAELRGWEWRHLVSRFDRSDLYLPNDTEGGKGLADVEPNGRSVAIRFNNNGAIVRYEAATGRELGRTPFRVNAGPTWQPGGHVFAAAAATEVLWIDPDSMESVLATPVTESTICDVKFSPHGARLAWADLSGRVGILDPSEGGSATSWIAHEPGDVHLEWSPDGRALASASWDETAKVWSADLHDLVAELEGHSKQVTGLEWTPDGRELLTTSLDGTIRLWRVEDSEALWERDFHQGHVNDVCVLEGGARALSVGFGGDVLRWSLDDPPKSSV